MVSADDTANFGVAALSARGSARWFAFVQAVWRVCGIVVSKSELFHRGVLLHTE